MTWVIAGHESEFGADITRPPATRSDISIVSPAFSACWIEPGSMELRQIGERDRSYAQPLGIMIVVFTDKNAESRKITSVPGRLS